MPKGYSGRQLVVEKNDEPIGGIRTKSFTIENEPIDVTTDDDDGIRKLLSEFAGTRSIDLSFDGIFKDETLLENAQNGTNFTDTWTIVLPSGGNISCEFFFTSLEISGEHEDAVEISGEAQSADEWTYTPPPA